MLAEDGGVLGCESSTQSCGLGSGQVGVDQLTWLVDTTLCFIPKEGDF